MRRAPASIEKGHVLREGRCLRIPVSAAAFEACEFVCLPSEPLAAHLSGLGFHRSRFAMTHSLLGDARAPTSRSARRLESAISANAAAGPPAGFRSPPAHSAPTFRSPRPNSRDQGRTGGPRATARPVRRTTEHNRPRRASIAISKILFMENVMSMLEFGATKLMFRRRKIVRPRFDADASHGKLT